MSDLNAGIVINEDVHTKRVLTAVEFVAQHRGHIVTSTGPVKDGDCITVRVCANCKRLHIAHNDEIPPQEPAA